MSSIKFQDLSGDEALVGGRERAQCGWLVQRICEAVADIPGIVPRAGSRREAVSDILGLRYDGAERYFFSPAFSTDPPTEVGGRRWNVFEVQLNTALALGGDPLKFAARVHGQCELHAYVEGSNRRWLADIVDRGLDTGVLRKESQGYGMGWQDVASLLRERDDEPVVTSYSVCDHFPDCGLLQEVSETLWPDPLKGMDPTGERFAEVWYDLDREDQWWSAVNVLRAAGRGLELTPENWDGFRFGDGRTAFDLVETIYGEIAKLEEV